jgi:hypothetical protein
LKASGSTPSKLAIVARKPSPDPDSPRRSEPFPAQAILAPPVTGNHLDPSISPAFSPGFKHGVSHRFTSVAFANRVQSLADRPKI